MKTKYRYFQQRFLCISFSFIIICTNIVLSESHTLEIGISSAVARVHYNDKRANAIYFTPKTNLILNDHFLIGPSINLRYSHSNLTLPFTQIYGLDLGWIFKLSENLNINLGILELYNIMNRIENDYNSGNLKGYSEYSIGDVSNQRYQSNRFFSTNVYFTVKYNITNSLTFNIEPKYCFDFNNSNEMYPILGIGISSILKKKGIANKSLEY